MSINKDNTSYYIKHRQNKQTEQIVKFEKVIRDINSCIDSNNIIINSNYSITKADSKGADINFESFGVAYKDLHTHYILANINKTVTNRGDVALGWWPVHENIHVLRNLDVDKQLFNAFYRLFLFL